MNRSSHDEDLAGTTRNFAYIACHEIISVGVFNGIIFHVKGSESDALEGSSMALSEKGRDFLQFAVGR